jgi:acyl-CoA thioester hydrolase
MTFTYSRIEPHASKRAAAAPARPPERLGIVSRPVPFVHRIAVRYLEVDRQGVVFNMWYLAYLDDALTGFLDAGGLRYRDMLAAGFDVQVVHAELDWHGPVGFGDDPEARVIVSHIGRTSFTLGFAVVSSGRVVVQASTVYVAVRTDGSGKCELPEALLGALGPVA